ncbi:hypothetical protein ES707_09196 [subsurface metagenome]
MPKIGEIRRGREIEKDYYGRYIWATCFDCGKERWVNLKDGLPQSPRCYSCKSKNRKLSEETKAKISQANMGKFKPRGDKAYNWKGGQFIDSKGYVVVLLQPDDFFYPMVKKGGYVMEHRLVVAKALNRCLLPWEIIHHKGARYPSDSKENKSDNRYPENLELLGCRGKHNTRIEQVLRRQAKEIKILQERVILLEAEVILLGKEAYIEQDA